MLYKARAAAFRAATRHEKRQLCLLGFDYDRTFVVKSAGLCTFWPAGAFQMLSLSIPGSFSQMRRT